MEFKQINGKIYSTPRTSLEFAQKILNNIKDRINKLDDGDKIKSLFSIRATKWEALIAAAKNNMVIFDNGMTKEEAQLTLEIKQERYNNLPDSHSSRPSLAREISTLQEAINAFE